MLVPAVSHAADADEGFAQVDVFLGQKSLDNDDWGDIDTHNELGVMGTIGKQWPVAVAADLLYSMGSHSEGGVDLTGNTMELAVGARKVFPVGAIKPYVGGGLAYVSASAKVEGGGIEISESTTAIGFWAGGGVAYNFGKIGVGLGLRYSAAKSDKKEFDAELGGLHYGLQGGYSF